MELLLKYFDTLENKIKLRYWDSRFLGHASHQDLLKNFFDSTISFDPNRLFQTSMNGPSHNMKISQKIINHGEEN